VILARAPVLEDDLFVLHNVLSPAVAEDEEMLPPRPSLAARPSETVVNFFEAERRAIVRAVEMVGWRISGRGGAAELLGLKPTTLHAKMKKLGIHRPTASADGPG
jgi:transcriptional regulator with GAF, ATPase, and Fis domain